MSRYICRKRPKNESKLKVTHSEMPSIAFLVAENGIWDSNSSYIESISLFFLEFRKNEAFSSKICIFYKIF